MDDLSVLRAKNRTWAASMTASDPEFFRQLAQQQNPRYLWIGCSDSRVPSTQLVDLAPGEMFVHRNVANVVIPTDLNCLSVIQFAVEALKVEHIIVCGHYGCGGVGAALNNVRLGLIDNWLRHVQDVRDMHANLLATTDPATHHDRLCELNVIEQAIHVCQTTIVQDAWARGQTLAVHGWVYGLNDGLVHDLHMNIDGRAAVDSAYARGIEAVTRLARHHAV